MAGRAPHSIKVTGEVAAALSAGRPVVALETTLIAHGLPRPDNLTLASELEALVRAEGAVPATVGVVGGVATVGLDSEGIARLARGSDVRKLSARDLPVAVATGADGATTVAATAVLAARAGIRLFATGGLGGVHRQASETWDESADLATLARTAVVVVCSGVKSILDVGATLERLETLGVPVMGYRTRTFAGFYLTDSGYRLDWSADSPAEIAAVERARAEMNLAPHALVVANPLPPSDQVEPELHDRVLASGLEAAARGAVTGKEVTPFLLEWLHNESNGASLRANVALIRRNVVLAAQIAAELALAPQGERSRST